MRFDRTALGQGANTALPMWGYYMNKIYADSTLQISKEEFEKPENPLSIELDCENYGTPTDFGTGTGGGVNWDK
ncbi:MAG: penicillin-binding protein 1A [Patiriisocius sp.]